MLYISTAAATRPAGAQARVERIHRFAVDAAYRQRTQYRADVQPDQPLVAGPGRVLDLQDIEVAVEQLADSCVRASIALVVHFREQPRAYLLGLRGRLRPGRHDLS